MEVRRGHLRLVPPPPPKPPPKPPPPPEPRPVTNEAAHAAGLKIGISARLFYALLREVIR